MTGETHTVESDTSTDQITAPDGWHFRIGDRSHHHYTYQLDTDKVLYDDGSDTEEQASAQSDPSKAGRKFGWECEIYWDQGHSHVVTFLPITHLKPNGNLRYGHPTHTKEFETEMDALQYAVEKATELR